MQQNSGAQKWNKDLQGRALDIASSDDLRLRVLAGPGTGKTYALRHLVMRLLERGDDPTSMLVVTFTRTAGADLAGEMQALDIEGCENIRAGTLHSLCFSILRSSEALQAHDRYPRPVISIRKQGGYLGFEYGPMLADLGATFGDVRQRTKLIRAYEAAWARQQQQLAGLTPSGTDQQFEAALVSWLVFHRAMLIGELVPETLKYLQANPLAPDLNRFERIIVDEYQDLNKAEQTIIDLLSTNGRLVIVGDQDQSIYSFRHANPDGIADFSSRHSGTVDLELALCRRCDQRIVNAANRLISHNHLNVSPPFSGMEVDPDRPPGEIDLIQWQSLDAEIAGIAAYVSHLISSGRYSPGEILIMTPRRRIGYRIRNILRGNDIEAHSFFHEEALEDDAAQQAFTALTLLADNQDRVALRFWLGFGSTTWLRIQYAKLRTHCELSGDSPWDAMQRILAGEISAIGYANLVARFRELTTILAQLEDLTGTDLIEALFPEHEEWSDPLREILSGATIDHLSSAADILKLVSDYVTQPEIPTKPNFVRIMSLHAAKGLTSEVAIITTAVNSLIPNNDSSETPAQQLQHTREQRRLFYVAITRGREVLLISHPAKIPRATAMQLNARVGRNDRTFPSRFLGELGLANVTRGGAAWIESDFAPS